MIRSLETVFVLLVTVFATAGAAPAEDTSEALKACATMTDPQARLACYDELGQRALQEKPAAEPPQQEETVQPVTETAPAPVAQPLPDELGESGNTQYVGSITSCKQGHYGDWYFFFDNGQVWKAVSNRRLRFKECDFNVTISKDAFGYKMQIDGEKKSIRVRRHQ